MNLEFPYQVVAFIDEEPAINEPVYYGKNGWHPQIALKRRFKIKDVDEDYLISKIRRYCDNKNKFTIETGNLTRSDRMLVKILEVMQSPELMEFHRDLITVMSAVMVSRYPDRDGANYLPHITVEYDGKIVIDEMKYCNKDILIKKVFLLKDQEDENSVAYRSFELG